MANLLSNIILQMLIGFFIPCLFEIASTDHVSVHPGENITLLCNITDYSEILWYQLRADEVKLLISAEKGRVKKKYLLSYNVDNRSFDVTQSSSSISLVIIGVRETDLGFYYCGGRNKMKHIQFGKPIRLNFPDDQHLDSQHPDTQKSASPAFYGIIITIILPCVCAVSVSLIIICSCLHCSRLQDICVSTCCSNQKDVDVHMSDFTSVAYTVFPDGLQPNVGMTISKKKNGVSYHKELHDGLVIDLP
ncbi:uncharacterized protein LOC124391998 [Silurus meridionalis]|uniref:uncharacterized protein LOC124391998 n=1 Tax=Silurus meridionalis TaxID=175797 RepID=UPI001EEC5235|nr:uncharacterized protein LOC124391998 [Silurus meridionalis]